MITKKGSLSYFHSVRRLSGASLAVIEAGFQKRKGQKIFRSSSSLFQCVPCSMDFPLIFFVMFEVNLRHQKRGVQRLRYQSGIFLSRFPGFKFQPTGQTCHQSIGGSTATVLSCFSTISSHELLPNFLGLHAGSWIIYSQYVCLFVSCIYPYNLFEVLKSRIEFLFTLKIVFLLTSDSSQEVGFPIIWSDACFSLGASILTLHACMPSLSSLWSFLHCVLHREWVAQHH